MQFTNLVECKAKTLTFLMNIQAGNPGVHRIGAYLTFKPFPHCNTRVAEVWNSWCLYIEPGV